MFDFIRKPQMWRAWDQGLHREIAASGSFSLKTMQDLAVYEYLRDARGLRIAEIGAGHSRLLPTISKANDCLAVDKLEGQGAGPTSELKIPGVRNVSAYLGEQSPDLSPGSFDVVFSVSVIEHVASGEELASFHQDQLRILKPGGTFLHAIDLYLEDEPAAHHVRRFEAYRDWVISTPNVEPVGHVYGGPCIFTCDLATNPDNTMYNWGREAPKLIELRQSAQSVSLFVAGRKTGSVR